MDNQQYCVVSKSDLKKISDYYAIHHFGVLPPIFNLPIVKVTTDNKVLDPVTGRLIGHKDQNGYII